MKIIPGPISAFRSAVRAGAFLCGVFALLFTAVPQARALNLVTLVQGSGTTTITSLVFNADGTISIEADQSGYLTNFGYFTGHFSYLAIPSPATILLVGTGTLTAANGSKLFLTASILEVGTDYPRTLDGVLTITGGTGRYAHATGALYTHGIDQESLTDTIQVHGTIVTAGGLLGGL